MDVRSFFDVNLALFWLSKSIKIASWRPLGSPNPLKSRPGGLLERLRGHLDRYQVDLDEYKKFAMFPGSGGEPVHKRLGGFLGASWGVLGATWGVLGASWKRFETAWRRLGGVLGASWSGLGTSHFG